MTYYGELFRDVSSTLINGKGRYPGGPNVDLAVVNVTKGKRSAAFTVCVRLC